MVIRSVLARSERAKLTARQRKWLERFSPLQPGLGLDDLAGKFGESYATVQRWASFFGYPIRDRRNERPSSVDWDAPDWTQPNAQIARELGVSRERVRQMREKLGVGNPTTNAERFEEFVMGSRADLHGTTVPEAILASGLKLSAEVARHILRAAGVQSFHRQPRWTNLDWRLPNKDLAEIYGLSQQYVANLRFKMKVGGAQWDLRGGPALDDGEYLAARDQETRKANQRTPATRAGASRQSRRVGKRRTARHV